MPTEFTHIVGEMQKLMLMRKKYLQSFSAEMGIAWEYVPVLEHIRFNPGCMQADISKKLRVTPSAVTQSTKKLEAAGMIEKRTDKDNLRVKRMYITDKGIRTSEKGTQIFDEVDVNMFEGFTKEDISQLDKLLNRVCGNISEKISCCAEDIKPQWELK